MITVELIRDLDHAMRTGYIRPMLLTETMDVLRQQSILEQRNVALREAMQRLERELGRMVLNRHDVALYQIREMHEWVTTALAAEVPQK